MFEIHHHVWLHSDSLSAIEVKVDQLLELLATQGVKMSQELDTLTTEVQENGTAIASAVTLIEGLGAFVRDHANDPAALLAMANELDRNSAALGAAVVANTPAAEPAPEP
jgi:hypothetical protein